MKDENRNHLADSLRRLDVMKSHQGERLDAHDAFRLLNDSDKGVFSDLYGSWAGTIHTSAYLPGEMKAWFALGGDREPSIFDFGHWLDGQDIEMNRITGEVDTDIPFLHMDEQANWFR